LQAVALKTEEQEESMMKKKKKWQRLQLAQLVEIDTAQEFARRECPV